jgi:hypothetical protein
LQTFRGISPLLEGGAPVADPMVRVVHGPKSGIRSHKQNKQP